LFFAAGRRAALEIDSNVAEHDDTRRMRRPLLSAQQRRDARDELPLIKWLRQIIIGSRVEAANAIIDRVPRRQHEDRNVARQPAQFPADFEATLVRQPKVENREVRPFAPGQFQAMSTGAGIYHSMICTAKTALDRLRDERIVFDQKYTGHR
jgi:hypothetical protein